MMVSVANVLLAVVPVLVITLYLQFRWKYRHVLSAASKLPCPTALPLIGNALLFLGGVSTLPKLIIKLTTRFKEAYCLWVGPVPVFVVGSPADVQIVLNSSNTIEKDDVYQFLKPFIGNGILISPAPLWKKYRRLVSPMLHPASIDSYLPTFNGICRNLTKKFEAYPKIDPRYDIFTTTVDAAIRTLMNRKFTITEKTKKAMHYLFEEIGRMFLSRLFKVWLHIDLLFKALYWRELDVCLKRTEACRAEYVERLQENWDERREREERTGEKSEPENHFAYLSYAIPEDKTEDHAWWDEVATMLVAATDTGVSAMSFFLLSIAIHPEVQNRIRKEILEVMGDSDRDVTTEDINALTYLSQALMESMRVHGVFPVILRKATRDTKITTATLPAGSRIILPLQAMGWDPDVFPEPHKYDPDRFSPENIKARHKYSFIPFSGGPRNCIGKKYGIFLMKTVMVHILRKFEVRTHMRMEDIEYEIKVIMFSKTPVPLEFIPIK